LYPPKSVRVAANQALSDCFPQGKYVRQAIKLGFRMLHPIRVTKQVLTQVLLFLAFIRMLIINFLMRPFHSRQVLLP
jgi:hypothetical protein